MKITILLLACIAIVLALLMLAMEIAAQILRRRMYQKAIKARLCIVCKRYGTEECPISNRCLVTKDKPYFQADYTNLLE